MWEAWIERITCLDIAKTNQKIIKLKSSAKVEDALHALDSCKILSAPVTDDKDAFVDFVDVLDFAHYVMGILMISSGQTYHNINELLESFQNQGKKFSECTVGDVLEFARAQNPFRAAVAVSINTPIRRLIQSFWTGVHRAALLDKEGEIISIISQSDVLRVLAMNMYAVQDISNKAISELGLGEPTTGGSLVTMHFKETVVTAIKLLVTNKVSAIPVVNDYGVIVANFSASDLRGLRKDNFLDLLQPVYSFLLKRRQIAKIFCHDDTAESLYPLTCKKHAKLDNVVFKLVATHVHRLWVVDENRKPIGIVSASDLMKAFL